MKRCLLCLLLLLLAASSLMGCADLMQLLPEPEEEGLPSAYVNPTPEAVFPPQMSTAARILARGELVVGVRYDLEPFSYITADSELAGMEVDLARELARRWLGSSDSVRFRQVRSDSAFQHLAEGTVDVVFAGIEHTQEQETRADFSPPYFMNGVALLTYPDSGLQGVAALGPHQVGVLTWADSRSTLAAAAPLSTTYVGYDNFFAVVDGLRTRNVTVYGDSRHRLERARRMVAGSVIVGQFEWLPVAMIYRENDPFFDNLVNLTFRDMVADGTRDALYARWLPATSPPALRPLPGDAPAPPLADSPTQLSTLDVSARILERNASRGGLAVGYFPDRWPYSGDRADGVPTGFEVRLMERVAEMWLGSREAVTFVPVTAEDALGRLQAGEVDVLVGEWTPTRAAELQVDFTIPLLDDGLSIFSLATNPIQELAALAGQPVGVVTGSPAQAALPALSQGVGMTSRGYPDFDAALAALQAGEVVALLTTRRPALNVHFRTQGFYFTDQRYTTRPIAWIVPQGDSHFRDLLNLTLAELEVRGVYQELYDLWFDDPIPTLDVPPGRPAIPLVLRP